MSDTTYAKATLVGEIANQQALAPTTGGLLTVNLKVSYDYQGRSVSNYIPVRFFGGEAESIATTFKVGMMVKVQADIKMWKGKTDRYHSVALYGTAINPVETLNDALPGDGDDIPFD